MQEKRIDDYWNADSNRHLSDSWKKTSQRIYVVWERLTKVQTTTRSRVARSMDKKLVKPLKIEKNKNEKNERPKLVNARRLRGICFIDPDDEDYKEKLSKMREANWKDLWHLPCFLRELRVASRKCLQSRRFASEKTPKSVSGCIMESHESTRQRVESSQPQKS